MGGGLWNFVFFWPEFGGGDIESLVCSKMGWVRIWWPKAADLAPPLRMFLAPSLNAVFFSVVDPV